LHRGTKNLAFRIPKNQNFRKFLSKTGPLVAPSANSEGEEPAKTIEEAKKYFGKAVDFYLDGGKLTAKPSTLIKISNGKYRILQRKHHFIEILRRKH